MRAFLLSSWRAAVLMLGCATLPEVHPWSAGSDGGKAPAMVGARGALSKKQAAVVLARLESKGAGTDLLARHLALEEEVAGRPLTVGNSATLLYDGPASYQAMFEAIERARDHINVEFYIIEDDEMGRSFGEVLLRKAAAGIAVNLMYDSVGSSDTPREFFERLRSGGVKVLEYNPVNPLKARRGWRVNNRDHRKVVIVDGRVAFTGGINISDVYSSGSSPGSSGAASVREWLVAVRRPGGVGLSAPGPPARSRAWSAGATPTCASKGRPSSSCSGFFWTRGRSRAASLCRSAPGFPR